MFVLALIVICVWLCDSIIDLPWLIFILLWTIYFLCTEVYHRMGYMYVSAWRDGWLARAVHAWFDVDFASEAKQRIEAMPPTDQYVFACEPHGVQCLHLVLGFAAPGGTLPKALSGNVRVVAHTSTRFIPFIRDILSAYGVVDSMRSTLDSLLANGYSLALVPSGVHGKEHALLDKPTDPHIITVYRRANRFGFLYMAAKVSASVVPVLSPFEHDAYTFYNQEWRAWPLVVPIGKNVLAPLHPVRFFVGKPIDTSYVDPDCRQSMQSLATRYYEDLAALAPPGYRVVYRYIDDSE